MLNLDTHILIHAWNGSLTETEQKTLTGEVWGISDIVLWEIEMLYARGRIAFGLDHAPLALVLRRIAVWPITPEVCVGCGRSTSAPTPPNKSSRQPALSTMLLS